MAFIPLPREFYPGFAYGEQPTGEYELDPNFSWASSLVFAGFWHDGQVHALLGGLPTTFSTTIKPVDGIVQISTNFASFPRPPKFKESLGSIVFDFTHTGGSKAASAKFFFSEGATNWQFFRSAADTTLSFQVDTSSANFTVPDMFVTGVRRRVAATWKDASNNRRLSVDREAWASSGGTFTGDDTETSDFTLLNNAAGNRNAEGNMSFLLLFNKSLPHKVLDDLKYNPAQVVRPTVLVPLFFGGVILDLNLISIMHHGRQLPHPWGETK